MKPISSFTGNNRFLSNFFYFRVYYNGDVWRSNEHAFQAAKFHDEMQKTTIRIATSCTLAKALGQKYKLRDDWEGIKLQVMYDICSAKFKNTTLEARLLNTRDLELIEGNWHGDKFWGVCNGKGENHLGKILMRIRDEIRQQNKSG